MKPNKTLDTYNKSAKQLAEYFRGVGSRRGLIEHALELASKADGTANLLELGCGDGRDASDIIGRVKTYLGIDYSAELLKIAHNTVPAANFKQMDMLEYEFPKRRYDVILAFASLLHINKSELGGLLPKIARSLKEGGVLYLTLKHNDEYKEELKPDQFGERMFYFYNPKLITEMSQKYFSTVYTKEYMIGHTAWLAMGLKIK